MALDFNSRDSIERTKRHGDAAARLLESGAGFWLIVFRGFDTADTPGTTFVCSYEYQPASSERSQVLARGGRPTHLRVLRS